MADDGSGGVSALALLRQTYHILMQPPFKGMHFESLMQGGGVGDQMQQPPRRHGQGVGHGHQQQQHMAHGHQQQHDRQRHHHQQQLERRDKRRAHAHEVRERRKHREHREHRKGSGTREHFGGNGGGSVQGVTIASVVSAIAMPMAKFGEKVATADRYLASQRKSALAMVLLVVMLMAAVFTVSVVIVLVTGRQMGSFGDPKFVKVLSMTVALAVVVLVILMLWSLMLRDQLSRNVHTWYTLQAARRVAVLVSSSFLVQFAAAKQLGTTKLFIQEMVQENTAEQVDDACSAGEVMGKASNDCVIDVCGVRNRSLSDVVHHVCANDVDNMLKELDDIAKDGVDKFDRRVLWDRIADGIDALRAEVLVQLDFTAPGSGAGTAALTAHEVRRIIVEEVVPILQLPAVEVYDLKVSQNYPSGQPGRPGSKAYASKVETWAACLANSACRWASWDPVSNTGTLDSADVSTPIFHFVGHHGTKSHSERTVLLVKGTRVLPTVSFAGKDQQVPVQPLQAYDDIAFVCGSEVSSNVMSSSTLHSAPKTTKHDATALATLCAADVSCNLVAPVSGATWTTFDVQTYLRVFKASSSSRLVPIPAEAGTHGSLCLRTTFASIFRDASAATDAVATTFRDLQPHLIDAVVAIVASYGSKFQPSTYRAIVDAALSDYYGGGLYTATLSTQVDAVFAAVARMTTAKKTKAGRYITDQRLLDKYKATPAGTWATLAASNVRMFKSAGEFQAAYPPYKPDLGERIGSLLGSLALLAGAAGLVAYCVTSIRRANGLANTDDVVMQRHSAARSLIIAGSIFALCVVVVGTYMMKARARYVHNNYTVFSNGQDLINSMQALVAADALLQAAPGSLTATAYMSAARATLDLYAKCNIITWGAVNVSPPVAEMVAYAVVAAALVAAALYTVGKLDPFGAVTNIQQLGELRERILSGDMPSPAMLMRVVKCCNPPIVAWNALTWLGVMVFALLNVYVMSNVRGGAEDYTFALDSLPDCV